MLNKMNEGFNKLIAYIKNSCKTSGSFMASFGVINFAFVVVLAFCIVVVSNLNMFGVFADEGHDYLADYADKNLIATYDISLAQDGSVKAYCYSSTATGTSTRAVILDGQGYALPFNARYSSGTLIKDISGDGTYYSLTDTNFPTVKTQAPSINFNGYGYVVPGENNDYEGNYFCAPWQQISVSSVDNFYVNKDSNIKFTSAAYLFYGFKSLENVDFTGLDFSECTDMKAMFYECQEFNSVSAISSWDTSNVTDMSFMFYNCAYIVDADLNSWNVGNVKYMNGMFTNAHNIKNIYVSDWDTHSLINISRMFYACTPLLTLDVSNWDTGNIVNMFNAFDTPKLTTLDVSNWDTHSLVNAGSLFSNCKNVTELDVSNWDVSHVTDMSSMFKSCQTVTKLDVSNWDTSNVTIMSNMFAYCNKVKVIDLSNWDVTNVTNIGAMFYECYQIDYLDMSDWDVTNVQSSDSLFTYGDIPDVIKTPKINPHDNLITIPSPFMHTLDDSTTQVKSFPVTTGTSVTLYKDINKQLLYSDDEAIYYKNSSGVCTVYETNGTTIHSTITCVNTYDIAASGTLNAYLFSDGLLILDGTGDLSSNQTNNLRAKLNETVATTSDSVKKIVASYGGFKPTGTLCKLNYYFSGLSNLEEFYANRMDFSNVQEATNLFDSSFNKNKNNTILDFSHIDLSSCYDISYMFKDVYSEKIDASYLKLISSDDVDCSYLFNNSTYTDSTIKDINMSHWENGNNISKLQYAFVGNPKLEKINFEGTDLGKSGAIFTYFFKTGLATVNKTNSTYNIKEIILPKSVGSNTIDISFMTTGLCQFDKAGNKLSSTIQNKLIPQGTTDGSVYKLVGTKKLLASGKISAGTLGASIYNADFYNTGLEYTAYSSVTVAPTVYDLNNDGSLKAYYYSDSNTGGGILLFDGEGPLDKNTMPGYITDHGSDIKRIVFSDTGFKPSGDMRFLFSGLGSTTKKISFKEDPLCTINLDKLDLSNVTSTKYLFSNSYFDTLVLPSMSTINSFDVESMLSGAKIYGTLDLTDFDFTNKINAEELFSGYNIDSNTASTVNIKLPNSLGIYEDEIDLPDLSSLTNKTWNGAYDAGQYMGIQPVSGDYHSKLIDNTSVVNTNSITYLKVVDKTIESNLKNGNTFKAALKSLAAQTGNNIQTITFSLTKQTDSQIATYLANGGIQVDDEGYTVMTMSGNTVTVYTSADKIYTNENSSNMFRCETDDETETLLDPELETITTISNLSKLNTSKTTDFEEMFSGLKNLTSITINSSVNWNTSKVTDFSRMFANCEKLSSLTLPSDFVSNTTDYIHTNYMFYGCKALSSIDISGWTATKYSKVYGMFSGCNSATSITLNKNLITANLDSSSDPEYDADEKRGLQSLFRDCSSLTSINLASANGVTDPFNFSTVTRTDSMFEGCESLTTLTLPSTTKIINTSVTNTASMFSECEALTTLNLSGCDMANVTKMYEMFSGCKNLSSLTLPNNFITNKITGVDSSDHEEEGLYELFYYCRNLSSLNLSGSDFSSINNYGRMFYHCDLLNGNTVTFPTNGFNSSPYSIEEMLYKSGFESIDLSAMNLSNLVSNQNIINHENTYDTDSDGDKLKEIILPSNVSNTYKAMVSAPAGYAWFGFDASNNKLGTATYKQIPKSGAVTNLAKIKLEKEILYQDGTTEYYRNGTNNEGVSLAKYDSNTKDCAWDISNAQDGSIMAYLYTNGLLILDGAGAVKRYISSSGFTITPWVDNGKYNDISKIVGSNNKFKPEGNIDALFNLGVFDNSFNNKSLTCIDFTNMDFSSVTRAFKLFSSDTKLSSLIGIETLDVSSVTNMSFMFNNCSSLPDLNLSGWEVSNCSNFEYMFYYSESTGTNGINLSGWTFKSASYEGMFSGAKLNALNISNWLFNSATSVTDMFYDATINNEIILPSSVGGKDITLPSLTGQKVWMGYDYGNNQVRNTTYAKLVNSEGNSTGELYKLKPKTSVLFTIDGVEYKMQDLKYTWDISKLENGTTKAYYFSTNGGTVVFNSEKLDDLTISDSDREVIHFGGYASNLRSGLHTNDTFDYDLGFDGSRVRGGSGLITGFYSSIKADLETETGYKDLKSHIGSSSTPYCTDLIFTPWSFVEVCTDYEVKHIVCNNDITVKDYNNLFRGLDNLTGTLDLNKFKLDSNITINSANRDDIFKRAFSYGDNLTIKFNSEINIVPYMGYYDIDERDFGNDITLDFRGCNIEDCVINDSLYEKNFGILINENRLTKVYVPDKLESNFTIEDLTYLICDNKNYEIDTYDLRDMMSNKNSKNIVMYEAYNDNGTPNDDSDDIFLGYTYHLVDSVHSYDNFTSSVSYLLPRPELDFYASYMAYVDNDFTSNSYAINAANINLFFERIGLLASDNNDLFHSQRYTYGVLPYGIIKQDSLKDSDGKFIIPYKTFLEAFERTLYKDSFDAEDFTYKMLSYMKDEIESNGGLDVTIKADLTDSNSNTNDFYLLNKYANEYINKMLNANINKEELDPLYYLDKVTVNVIGLVSDAFSNAFNFIRSNYSSQEKAVKFKLVDFGDGVFYPDDETFIDPSNILFRYGDDYYDGPKSDDRCLTFSDSDPDYYIYSGTITPEMDGVYFGNEIATDTYAYAIPGYDFTPSESINLDITYEIDFGSGIHFTNSDEYFEIIYLDGSNTESYIEYDDSNLVGKKTFTVGYNNYHPVKDDGSPNAEEGAIAFECYTNYDGYGDDLNEPFFTGSYDVTIKIPKKANIVNESNKKYIDETAQADLITNFILFSVSSDLLTNAFSSRDKNIVRETDNYYVIKNPNVLNTDPNIVFIMYDLDEEANIPFYYASTDDIVSDKADEFTAYSITDFKALFDNGSRALSDSDVETYLKSATIRTSNGYKMYTDKNLPGVLIATTSDTSETYVALPKSVDKLVHVSDNTFSDLLDSIGGILYKVVPKYYLDNDENNIADLLNTNTLLVNVNELDISLEDTNPNKDNISVSGYTLDNMYDPNDPDFAITFPDLVVTYTNNKGEDIELVKDVHYSVSYNKNDVAGDSDTSFTITGIGPNVIGSRTINFNINGNMFTIDGVDYKYADLKYTWDISKDENDSVYAYLFKDPLDSNELTLVFNNELLDKKVSSDLSSLVDGTDNIVKKYNGCVNIVTKTNNHMTDPDVITPWSVYDDAHTSTIEHVAFNNMIHFDSLAFMFAKLYGLDYIKLEDNKIDFELINSNNDDYSSYYAFYDDYNLEIDLDGEIKLPKQLFELPPSTGTHYNWILDFSDATFTSGDNNVIDDYDLGIRTSDYDSLKIFIPEDISSLGDYAKYAFNLDQTMFGVYDSDDNFLGYSPYMIDQNDRSFDKVISSVTHVPSYVVPCDELGIYACYELLLDTSLSDDLKLAFTYKFFIYLFNELYDATDYDILLDDIFDSPLVSKNDLKNIITSVYWNIASGYSDNLSLVYELVDYIKEERLGHTLNSHMSLIGSDKEYDYTNSSNEFTKTRRYLNDGLMILANPELEDPNANTTPPTTLNYLDNIKVNITNAVSEFNHALSNVFKLAILNSLGNVVDYVRDNDNTNAIINHCSLFDDDFLSIAEVTTTQELLDEKYKSSDNTCKWFLTSDNKYIVIKNIIDDGTCVVYEMPGEKIEYYHIGYAPTTLGSGLDDSMVTTSIPGTFNESDLLSSSYIEANMNKYIGIPDAGYGSYGRGFLSIESDNASDSYYAFPIESLVYQPVMDTSFSTLATKVGNWVFKAIANGLFTMEDSSYDYNKITINVGSLSIADSNAKVTVNLPLPSQAYTGSAITIDDLVVVTYENNDGEEHILEQDKDYTLTYDNNVNAGQAKITIIGDGTNVTGSRDVYFNITRALDLSSASLLDSLISSNPDLLNKTYDGTNIVTSLVNKELTTSDNSSIPSNMKVIVNATYDDSNAGSNKDVTLTYSYKDLSGNDIDTTYYTIIDSSVTYKGNISKKKIDVTFNTANISKTYDKTSDINIGITCDDTCLVSGDTLVLPTSVHGNFARVTASQLDSDIIDITLDSNWYNIDTINANYELDSSDAPDTIAGLINKKEVLYDLTHSLNDTVNVYHYMKVFDGNKDYMLNTILDDTSVIAGDDIGIVPGVYLVAKSSQVGSYHLSDGDVSFDPGVSLDGSDSDNYFIKQPEDTPKFSNLYLEICNKLINDGGSGNINITMPPNPTYTGNEFDIKSQLIIRDNSCYPSYTLVYGSDKDYILKYFDEDGNEISSIKDAGIYSIKVIGQNNYSGEKDLDFYVYKKSISRDDIVLAEKNITKVKDGLDYVPTYFDSDELHLTYTNTLVSPNEVVPIYYDLASFVKDDYSDILYEANENTETTLRNIKFEDIFIDDDYTNNYEFDYDITSMSNTLFVDNANYLIDNVNPRVLDISIEEMKAYGRGMPITFNVIVSEDIGNVFDDVDALTTAPGIVLHYKIGNRPDVYSAALSEVIEIDPDYYTDRYGILKFESTIDNLLDYGMPKDQCGVYPISIDSLALYRSSFIRDSAGNDLDLDISNIDGINPFDINEVNVNTKGFVIDISHVKSERDASDSGYDKSYYHLVTDANLVLSGATDNDKDISLLSKLKLTITNASDDTITKTYTYDDLDFYGALDYTRNELGKDYDIVINLSCLTFHDDDDLDGIEHLGLFRKNDTSGYRVELSIDEDALTNDTGNTNIEAKASNIVIFNAPEFALDDEDDDFNPNKYFTFVYTDALGVPRYILLAPNGDSTNGYKFINALTGEEVYFYQDDKISILNDLDISDTFNEFHFDIISDLKGLVLDTPVMNVFGMDAALNIDYVFSDVSNFLRDNVINNIDNSVYDVISDLYLHYDSMEGPDEFYHFIARNSGIKNIILRVRTIDDITRDVLKVINDNSKNVLDKDSDYIFINPYAKDFSIIDPDGDIGNYVPDGGAAGDLTNILRELIAHDDNLNLLPEGTFSKELERRNTINPITKDNLKQTLLDIALDSYNGFSNVSKMKDLLDKDPLTDSDIEEAMIAYQKMPSWVVKNYLDNDLVVNDPKTFKYYVDKLFDLYYGVKDDTGAIITPGVIDGYGTKDAVSDNENFEVFGLINKVDKPNASDKVFLDVRKITDSNELDDVRSELNNYYLNKSLSFDDKVLTPYDIKLYVKNLSSGNKNYVQPKSGESILVKLELDPLFYYTDFKIYHTTHKDDGTVDEIDSLPLRKDLDLTNNKYYVYFEADSFSTFTITCDAKTIVVSEDGEIDSLTNKYKGGSITPNGLIPILDPNVTKTKLFTITLNNDYKAEIYKDFASSPFMTIDSNKMITLDNLDSDSDNIYLLVKYIYDPKVDPADPEPTPEKPKDLSSATITIQVLSNKKFIDGYKDNTFRPNEYMTRAEFAKVISSLSSNFIYSDRDKDSKVATNTYSDIKDTDWYKDYVGYLTDKNILRGYSANNGTKNIYKGNSYIKRSEVSKILTSMFDIKSNDISIINYANEIKGRWYENSVSKLIKAGYLRGYSDGTIKAENYMTRAEVVALINRVVKNDYANINPALVKGYKDISKGSWYYNDIIAASN